MIKGIYTFLLSILLLTFAVEANARFIQPDWWDPTVPGVGTNRYSYSFNNPINRSDRSGHRSLFEAIGDAFRSPNERVVENQKRAAREQAVIESAFDDVYNSDRFADLSPEQKIRTLGFLTERSRSSLSRYKQIIEANGGSAVGIGIDIGLEALEHGGLPMAGAGALSGASRAAAARPSAVSGIVRSTAKTAKGQTAKARNLTEQIALSAVRADPRSGTVLAGLNKDANFAARHGWSKMEQVFRGTNGGKISVHYQVNRHMPNVAFDVKIVGSSGF